MWGPWKHGSYGYLAETVWSILAIPVNAKCGKVKSGFTELVFPHICVILWQNFPIVLILNLCSIFFFLLSPMRTHISSHCFPLNFYWHLYFWMKAKLNECELDCHYHYIDYAVGCTYEPGHDTYHSPHLLSRFKNEWIYTHLPHMPSSCAQR